MAELTIYTLKAGFPLSPQRAERVGLRPGTGSVQLLIAAHNKIEAMELAFSRGLSVWLRDVRLAYGNAADALRAADVFASYPVVFVQRHNAGPVVGLDAADGLTGRVIGSMSLVEPLNGPPVHRFTPAPQPTVVDGQAL